MLEAIGTYCNAVDAVLLVIWVAAVFIGRKNGFLATVLSFGSVFIAAFAARQMSPVVAQWIAQNNSENTLLQYGKGALTRIAFVVLTAIFGVALRTVIHFLRPAKDKKSLLGGADRLLGMLLGAVKGAVLVAVIALGLHLITLFMQEGELAKTVAQSKITAFIISAFSSVIT